MSPETVAGLLLMHAVELLPTWLPGGSFRGQEYTVANPTRDDGSPGSFKINIGTGMWADFATEDRGGDLITLRAYVEHQGDEIAALRECRELVESQGLQTKTPKKRRGRPPKERAAAEPVTLEEQTTQDIKPPEWTLSADPVTASWEYRDAEGNLLFWVVRAETDKGKETLPVRWVPSKNDHVWNLPPGKPPVFGRHRITQGAAIVWAEGEKTASHLQSVYPDSVAITTQGGAGNLFRSDLTGLEQAASVTVFADADQPGEKYAAAAAIFSHLKGCEVHLLDVAALGWANGQDAADFPDLDDKAYAKHVVAFSDWLGRLPDRARAERIIEVCAQLEPLDFQIVRKDAAKLAGISVAAFDEQVAKARPKGETTKEVPQYDEAELLEQCRHIAADPLTKLDEAMAQAGVIGERRVTRFAYLCIASAHFHQPSSGVLKGGAGGGKSTSMLTPASLFPEEMILVRTGFSPKSLVYLQGGLKHRTIILHEAESLVRNDGDEKNDRAETARVLLSEHKLVYSTVEKDADTGKFAEVTYTQEGPCNLLTSTTRAHLDPELESRMISLHIDDNSDHANEVILNEGRKAEGLTLKVQDMPAWHAFARWVRFGPQEVLVPYGSKIAKTMQNGETRTARDVKNLLAVVRASALVNRLHRKTTEEGALIATSEDYAVAHEVLAEYLDTKMGAIPKEVLGTFEKLRDLIQEKGSKTPAIGRTPAKVELTMPIRHMADILKLPRAVLDRRIKACVTLGLIERVEGSMRSQPSTLSVTREAAHIIESGSRILPPEMLNEESENESV